MGFVVGGLALLGWPVYDASSVRTTLGLRTLLSEAVVALGGLVGSGSLLSAGFLVWRAGRLQRGVKRAR